MTQIVTVSAATAAYATEGLKPSSRISGSAQTQETVHAQTQEARAADTRRHVEMMNAVGPPAVAVFFLTAGERGRSLAQATMREAEEAYFFGREDIEETSGNAQERAGQEQQQDETDDEEFHGEQTEILGLPAPEGFA